MRITPTRGFPPTGVSPETIKPAPETIIFVQNFPGIHKWCVQSSLGPQRAESQAACQRSTRLFNVRPPRHRCQHLLKVQKIRHPTKPHSPPPTQSIPRISSTRNSTLSAVIANQSILSSASDAIVATCQSMPQFRVCAVHPSWTREIGVAISVATSIGATAPCAIGVPVPTHALRGRTKVMCRNKCTRPESRSSCRGHLQSHPQ